MTQSQLDYFGKEASLNYLQNNVSLNDSIIKTAGDNALSREQVNRVVETANTSTYLSLFKTAEDKYIEFPVADAEKVAEAISTVRPDAVQLNDYDTPPEQQVLEANIFPQSEDALEKNASVSASESLQFYQTAKYAENQLIEKLSHLDGRFSEETGSLYNMIKQAVLQEQSFGHIKVAMEQHLPGKITDSIIESIKKDLTESDRIYNIDFEEPEKTAELNTNNELLKKLETLHSIVEEHEKTANYLKLVGATLAQGAKSLGSIGKFIGTHPKTMGAIGLAGVGTTIGYKSGKAISDEEQSALKTKPEAYKKR